MSKNSSLPFKSFLSIIFCFPIYSLFAQNVGIGTTNPQSALDVTGSNSILGRFTNSAVSLNYFGIFGACNNTPNYGTGIYGKGGLIGISAEATLAGDGNRTGLRAFGQAGLVKNTGLYAVGTNGSQSIGVDANAAAATDANYGVKSAAFNGNFAYGVYASADDATNNFGIAGNASGGNTAYGIYGFASGATTNWAGYFSSGNVYVQNNLGIGTLNPLNKLHVVGNIRMVDGNQAANKVMTSDANGIASWQVPASIGGSGTTNYIPKFSPNGTTLANSNIFDNGTNVGIGIITPGYKLDVRGDAPIVTYINSTSTGLGTIALAAQHSNAAGAGTAISALGGYAGVEGVANFAGSGERYGVRGTASNGTANNTGIWGAAVGGSIAYGIYGNASGATTNWAGYFASGNVYIQNRLGIGTTNPFYPLEVKGSSFYTGAFTNSSASSNSAALFADCSSTAGAGIGIYANGGYIGVFGNSVLAGSGNRTGVWGIGQNGNGVNTGVYGNATGGTTAIGIWGNASGATTNWAGQFVNGNVFIQNNLAIGTFNTSLAKMQIQGAVGNTVAMFSNTANSLGLSLISDWPGIYFNSYYNGGAKSMAASGYASAINGDQGTGGITFHTSNLANSSAGGSVTLTERMRLTAAGFLGIGTINPTHPMEVISNTALSTGYFENVITGSDSYALVGACQNTAGLGIGLGGYGGRIGVDGYAYVAGTGTRYGIRGSAIGGSTAYGIYGSASGATTNWAGYFVGATFCTAGVWTGSDRKLKNDIQPLKNAMEIINQLKPTAYSFKTREYKQMNLPEGLQYGLIADEVQLVMPGAVKKAIQPASYSNNDEKNGKKLSDEVEFNTVNYTEMIPVLIGAVKEQNVIIAELRKEIEALKKQKQ